MVLWPTLRSPRLSPTGSRSRVIAGLGMNPSKACGIRLAPQLLPAVINLGSTNRVLDSIAILATLVCQSCTRHSLAIPRDQADSVSTFQCRSRSISLLSAIWLTCDGFPRGRVDSCHKYYLRSSLTMVTQGQALILCKMYLAAIAHNMQIKTR